MPGPSRVAILGTLSVPGNASLLRETEAAATGLGIRVQYLEIRGPDDIEPAFRDAVAARAEALLVQPGSTIRPHRRTIVDLATRARLPIMDFAEEGGLVMYGVNTPDLDRRAALYVERILKGAKPADLPVEQPTKFDVVVNLQTARALGLTIPPSVLAQATGLIQ